MKKVILIFFGLFWISDIHAQESADQEQNNLKLCYEFSKLLGQEIESLPNPVLYETIHDWLGTPYKYSGDCKDGIDCSGFVCMLYQKVYGMELGASAAEIYKSAKPLKKNSLHEGDLVFFRINKKRVSHVGIYLMNNKFAHATVQNGVIISDLDEAYYKKYFFKGGRVTK